MLRVIKHSVMVRSRTWKLEHLLQMTAPGEESSILDVGVADVEYSPVDNFLEKHYSHPRNITALSIYPLDEFRKRYPETRAVTYSGGVFPFADKQFSIAYSNAVLEHVGGRADQVLFVRELNRVSQQFYITTPAREFPIEQHTNFPLIHWLPKPIFDKVATCLGKGWASGNYMRLLSRRALEVILEDSLVKTYRIGTQRLGMLPLSYWVWGK